MSDGTEESGDAALFAAGGECWFGGFVTGEVFFLISFYDWCVPVVTCSVVC